MCVGQHYNRACPLRVTPVDDTCRCLILAIDRPSPSIGVAPRRRCRGALRAVVRPGSKIGDAIVYIRSRRISIEPPRALAEP
jgi:hypothetical protein